MSVKTARVLQPRIQEILNESNEKRIEAIKEGVFITYRKLKEIWQEIEDLFDQPVRPRMEGLTLISPTNNGKTTLIIEFIKRFSTKFEKKELTYIETPERTTLKEFYTEVLNVLGFPAKSSETTGDLRRKILKGVKEKRVKMLFVDEIHNLLDSGRDSKKDVLNGLKSLSNKAEIPIILIGTDIAEQVLSLDEQVRDRYPVVELPLWKYDGEFRNVLATFESYLPLRKPSYLYEETISKYIHELSKGKIGRVATILRKASISAIRDGTEQITLNLLKSMNFRWK